MKNEKSRNKKRTKISKDMLAIDYHHLRIKTQSNHLYGLSDKSLNHAWAFHGDKNH